MKKINLEIVLYEAEIPWNTGNIGRLCVANSLNLHLVKPLGFSLEDKFLKRAGLDYWQFINLKIHENWQALKDFLGQNKNYYFFSKKAEKVFWDADFKEGDILVFGPETRGLPDYILEEHKENCLSIPILNSSTVRSLNLSSSVSIAVYEAMRKILD